jgi:hypothetical protein
LGWISEKLAAVPKEQSAPKSGKNAICWAQGANALFQIEYICAKRMGTEFKFQV